MEVASNHRRDGSLSSYGSIYSVEIDLSMDESIGPDSVVRATTDTRPTRQRLGAEMAIIACTSPEIKALNLPITPSFPQGMESLHYRSNSSSTFSSCSSASSAGSRKNGTLSSLLDAMDDVECSPVTRDQSDKLAMHVFMDQTDELVRAFKTSDLKDLQKKQPKMDEKKRVWFDDKENVHPNLLQKQDHGKRPFGFQSSGRPYKPTTTLPRPSSHHRSLHRRASWDNLPSPGEICEAPKPVRRATSTSIPFLPSDMNQPNYYQLRRSDHQRRGVQLPKSLSLMTGFR